jgi:hypothetical protein
VTNSSLEEELPFLGQPDKRVHLLENYYKRTKKSVAPDVAYAIFFYS